MNGKFLNTLLMTPLADGRTWRVEAPFAYRPASGGHITVASGFVTDLASIPRVAWIGGTLIALGLIFDMFNAWSNAAVALGLLFVFLSPYLRHDGKYTEAAVVHDWLYRTHIVPRWQADGYFLEMMKLLKCAAWQRWIIFVNVRLFGWIAWTDDTRWRKTPGIKFL